MASNLVRLRPDLILRCRQFAERSVDDYRAGHKNESRFYSTHGMESNVEGQAVSKMAECAFCIWLGLDPICAVDWSATPDAGCDILFHALRIDVKQTKMSSRFLLWPATKVRAFARKQFDLFALVKSDEPEFLIRGGTTKEHFARHHQIAPRDWKISENSLYLDENELRPAETLKLIQAPPALMSAIADDGAIDWLAFETANEEWSRSWKGGA